VQYAGYVGLVRPVLPLGDQEEAKAFRRMVNIVFECGYVGYRGLLI